ncbi:MAG: hypothetical protein FJX25_11690 [Alphaproteobacteria bacterium]|nr:hypothetical protein [Alphaproteobacteria bacterium]
MQAGRWTEQDSAGICRITRVDPRVGSGRILKTDASLGPRTGTTETPATPGAFSAARFTNGENNGLYAERTIPRDDFSIALIAWLEAAAPAQGRK